MESIIRKIRTYYPVSDEALEALVCLFKRCVFPAKTIIIHAGKLDRKVYFIEKGITRSYVLHGGTQITTSISVEQLDKLYRSYMDLANWMRVLQQENFLRLQDIHIQRLNWSAQERYEYLTKECPELFQRVKLGYIASFLGITQQSLSRIRANRRFLT